MDSRRPRIRVRGGVTGLSGPGVTFGGPVGSVSTGLHIAMSAMAPPPVSPPPVSPFPRVSMALAAETIHYLLTQAGPQGLSTADLADVTGMSACQVGNAISRRLRGQVRSYSTGIQQGLSMGRRSRWTLRSPIG